MSDSDNNMYKSAALTPMALLPMALKGSAWGSWNGQKAHLWSYHGGKSQRWYWK